MYYLLYYDYVDNIVEERAPWRDAHLALVKRFVDRDELVLGGALADPPDGAVLVFRTTDHKVIEEFVAADPYVANELVTDWRIREWTVVAGAGTELPTNNSTAEHVRRFAGAIIGGAIGVTAYWLMLRAGMHMLAGAGAGVALGVSAAARTRSLTWAVVAALLAVGLCIGVEWWFRPFIADPSLGYFLLHMTDLPTRSLISLAVTALVGFFLGRGR